MISDAEPIGSAEACSILGVDRSTLLRWTAAGRVTGKKLGGATASFVFDRAEIERVRTEIEDAVVAAAVDAEVERVRKEARAAARAAAVEPEPSTP